MLDIPGNRPIHSTSMNIHESSSHQREIFRCSRPIRLRVTSQKWHNVSYVHRARVMKMMLKTFFYVFFCKIKNACLTFFSNVFYYSLLFLFLSLIITYSLTVHAPRNYTNHYQTAPVTNKKIGNSFQRDWLYKQHNPWHWHPSPTYCDYFLTHSCQQRFYSRF